MRNAFFVCEILLFGRLINLFKKKKKFVYVVMSYSPLSKVHLGNLG